MSIEDMDVLNIAREECENKSNGKMRELRSLKVWSWKWVLRGIKNIYKETKRDKYKIKINKNK